MTISYLNWVGARGGFQGDQFFRAVVMYDTQPTNPKLQAFQSNFNDGIFDELLNEIETLSTNTTTGLYQDVYVGGQLLDIASFFPQADLTYGFDASTFEINNHVEVLFLHLARNILNTEVTYYDVISNPDDYVWVPISGNLFHIIDNDGQYFGDTFKVVAADGGREYIFQHVDGQFELVTNPVNAGSYNFSFIPGLSKIQNVLQNGTHNNLDIVPWTAFGNMIDDTTLISDRGILDGEMPADFPALLNAGTEAIILSGGPDVLAMSNAQRSEVFASGGNDLLISGAQHDTINGGTGNDTVSYDASLDGVAVNLGEGFARHGSASHDNEVEVLVSVENIIGSDFGDILIGASDANSLTGGLGRDILDGGAGNDTLVGGDGEDSLIGGTGQDVFVLEDIGSGDAVLDYRSSDNDVLDISDLAQSAFDGGQLGQNLVRVVRDFLSLENIFEIQVNRDGLLAGFGWETIGSLHDTFAGETASFYLQDGATLVQYQTTAQDTLSDWSLSSPNSIAIEDEGSITFTLSRANVSAAETVYASVTDINTVNSGDYTAFTDQAVAFAVGQQTATVSVSILDDAVSESYETYRVVVRETAGGTELVSDDFGIFDDDPDTSSAVTNAGFNLDDQTGDGTDTLIVDYSGDFNGQTATSIRIRTGALGETINLSSGDLYAYQYFDISGFEHHDITATVGDDTITTGAGNDTIRGGAGDDTIDAGGDNDTIFGGSGNDSLIAGSGNDSVNGGDGDDVISGFGGDDTLSGSFGNDNVSGNAGNDLIGGEDGNDTIMGGSGNDSVYGGAGDDDLSGGADNDLIIAGGGNDIASGGDGNDIINGYGGNDSLSGNAGNDFLSGNAGNDLIGGEEGEDTLLGGSGNDSIYGGDGNDILTGGTGSDLLNGGDGFDTADYSYLTENLVVSLKYGGAQTISASAGRDTFVAVEAVLGGAGNDLLVGSSGGNVIDGGAGDDQIYGIGGGDVLRGGSGNDLVEGSGGNDAMDGGTGDADVLSYFNSASGVVVNLRYQGTAQAVGGSSGIDTFSQFEDLYGSNAGGDTLVGDSGENRVLGFGGDDLIFGYDGADDLIGMQGNDTMNGGLGADTLAGGGGSDTFDFNSVDDSTFAARDTIADFDVGGAGTVDLSTIDANSIIAGNQAFNFIGGNGFSNAASELRFVSNGTNGFILGDVDGDGDADLNILLMGVTTFNLSDMVL